MKKLIKVSLIIAAILIPLGIIFVVVGTMMGGKGFSISTDGKLNFFNEQSFEYENYDLEAFENIDVDAYNGRVIIKASKDDTYGINVKLDSTPKEPDIKVENGILKVKEYEHNSWLSFNFGWFNTERYIEIYVPEDVLDSVNIDTSNGRIELSGISLNELTVNTSNGKIEMTDLKADKCDVKTSNGAIAIIESEIENSRFVTSNGKISIEGTFKDVYAKTSNGSIDVSSDISEEYYKISAKTSNGSVRIDGDKVSDEYTSRNSGEGYMELKTSNGSINMSFKK